MAVLPSPLSNSIQGINESTVSGSIFGGNKPDPETKSTLQSLSSSVSSLQSQVNELGKNNITNIGVFANFQQSFATQIDSVRLQLSKVNQTLESVATITASESAIEKQKDLYEQEQQNRLVQAGARGGQESLLETKIQSALSEPVKRIGNKISFGFQNLMSFITTLLGGWLTLEGIKVIKAYQDGDKKQLDDIKNSVIKTLGIAGGVFLIINIGIGKVISTITGLVANIGKFLIGGLIIKPFQAVMSGLGSVASGIFGGNKPPAPPAGGGTKGPKSGGGGLLSGIGKIITGVSGGMNFLNGENVDGALAAISLIPATGKVGFGIKAAAGLAFGVDEVLEMLGKNFTGADPKLLKQKRKQLEEAKNKDKDKLKSSPLKKSSPPKPAAAKPAPTTSMMPPASNLQINAQDTQKAPDTSKPDTQKAQYTSKPDTQKAPDTSKPNTQKAPDTYKPDTQKEPDTLKLVISAPSPERVKQFEQAWKYKDTPLARGRIEGAWNKMSPEEKQQAKDWAESTGKDWNKMKLPDTNKTSSVSPKQVPKPAETSLKPSTAQINPAQTTKMQTVPFNIGPEPEPKPNIVYAPSGPSASRQQQPFSTGAASDVPAIPSSNPDNFYVLYSQVNYNVVM